MKKIIDYIEKMNLNDIDNIYKCLVSSEAEYNIDINTIYNEIKDDNYNFILEENKIIIDNINNNNRKIKIQIFHKMDKISENNKRILEFLHKKKITFKIEIYINMCYSYTNIEIDDIDNAIKIIDFANFKVNKDLKEINPLLFGLDSVALSFDGVYSYIDILGNYLSKYNKNKNITFKDYMINNYYNLTNEKDLHKYLDFNKNNIKLSDFFNNLEEITNLILFLFQNQDYEDFKTYYKKIIKNKENKYLKYDDDKECSKLFERIVIEMYNAYDSEKAKENILKFVETGSFKYITRKNDLRKKVMNTKGILIYLSKIDLKEEIDNLIEKIVFNKKQRMLEKICKENYKMNPNDKNLSKVQVIRGIIRMTYGDYSAITRKNGARKIAIDNFDKTEIESIIRKTLYIDDKIDEKTMYQLYAEYIERICIG